MDRKKHTRKKLAKKKNFLRFYIEKFSWLCLNMQVFNCIRNYCFGKVCATAAEMTADAIQREAYHELYDLDKDGKLDTGELKAALENAENHTTFLDIFKKMKDLKVYPMIWVFAVEMRDTKFPGFDDVDSILWALAPGCIVRFVENLPEKHRSITLQLNDLPPSEK